MVGGWVSVSVSVSLLVRSEQQQQQQQDEAAGGWWAISACLPFFLGVRRPVGAIFGGCLAENS